MAKKKKDWKDFFKITNSCLTSLVKVILILNLIN